MSTPRRAVAAGVVLLLAGLASSCGQAGESATPSARRSAVRNVVLISLDTCRADHLSCYGSPRPTTPNIDALANDGVLFTRASTTNPITLPAHSSMLTGTIPPDHGVHDNHNYRLADTKLTLAEILRDQGYQTAAFVGSFVLDARFGLDQGFETYDDELGTNAPGTWSVGISERSADEVTAASMAWLDGVEDDPFFMFLHYFDPHVPYQPPEPFASRFPDSPYAGEIAFTDHWVGQLVGELKRKGLYDSTLIVITSDHGESLGEHGEDTHSFFIYQSTTRVPLIVRSPSVAGGKTVDTPVSVTDIVPTVLGQLGLQTSSEFHGQDLFASREAGGVDAARRSLYAESLYPTKFGCNALRAVTRGPWKYIHTAQPELYDLVNDPGETINLFDEQNALAGELANRLRATLQEGERRAQADGTLALDVDSTNRLQSLGYVGGGAVDESFDVDPGLADAKDFIEVYERLMWAYRLLADQNFREAEAECVAVLAQWPDVLDALYILGTIARLEGRTADAAERFSEYVAGVGRLSDATAEGSVVRRDGELAEVYSHLGTALAALEGPERAQELYRKALELAPAQREAFVQLTGMLTEIEDAPEAIALARRALAADPGFVVAHHRLGLLLLREGNDSEAAQHLREVVRIDPRNVEVLEFLRELEASQGQLR